MENTEAGPLKQNENMTTSDGFDAQAYKATTQRQWDQAAEAWHRWGPVLEEWLGPATERMLDLAAIGPGSRVLDVAAGAGGQTLAAARRAMAGGFILATDISLEILQYAKESARREGLSNVEILQVDGETLDLPERFDAAISRVGLIYFPDQVGALTRIRECLRPGGRFATVTYSTPDRNEFFAIPVAIARRRANLPAPLPGQPGPFSLGAEGALENLLERAGFTNIEVHRLDSPVRMASAAEFTRFARESFGALHQMMSALSEAERADAWQEIEAAMKAYESPTGFEGPCELWVGAGTNP